MSPVDETGRRRRCTDPECTRVNIAPPGECLARARARGRASAIAETGVDPYETTWFAEDGTPVPEGDERSVYAETGSRDEEHDEEELAEVPLALLIPEAHETLVRSIRRKLTEPGGGDLTHDLTAAVLQAAHELLGYRDECTVAELNELFGLSWREPHCSLPLDDLPLAISEIEQNLYYDWDMLEFLDCTVASNSSALGSSPEGSATMMSDGGIGLYEFTVDDGVYFFVLAEPDVCESQWWYAHGVNDMESRTEAIRSAKQGFAMSEDIED